MRSKGGIQEKMKKQYNGKGEKKRRFGRLPAKQGVILCPLNDGKKRNRTDIGGLELSEE